ncbi:MAG: hypothetical protein BAX61_13250 [Psychrobacter sp. B29-1]|uniref:hypothetical protein n=1 Tax=Psychrobacter sp. B29-1 TaxID=1867800 RepID=UPI000869BADF|nr:hypothetical protein [Psychrobacter sp. B29-1]OEH66766.1 MAG: hypothetical protein BAX61_13250 [Psychrobacter sp. B29-1]
MNYVTSTTIAASLNDIDWAALGNEQQAVLMANAWLNEQRLPDYDVVPTEILAAGAYIAKEVIAGTMYQGRKDGLITSKSVKAGSVSSSKTYAEGVDGQAMSAGESMALVLIKPFKVCTPIVVPLGRF